MEISCANKRPCPAPVAVPVPVSAPCCGGPAPVMVARPACGAGIVGVGGGVPALMGPGGIPVIQVCQGAKKEGEGDKPAEAK